MWQYFLDQRIQKNILFYFGNETTAGAAQKLGGAKITLKTEVKHPYLEEFELSWSKSSAYDQK